MVTVEQLMELARQNPGQPVAIVSEGDHIQVGILNLFPNDDDWFYKPVNLETSESTGLVDQKTDSVVVPSV